MRYLLGLLFIVCSITLPAETQIDRFRVFYGDRHGDFSGDIVVCLADGSAWKGHPKDRDTILNWKAGEVIEVSLRTSHYWFKREHKFELINLNRGEFVRAMSLS